MERRLYKQIMVPAMLATWFFGLLLVLTPGIVDWSHFNWWYVKFAAVILMTGFQGAAGKWRRNFLEDRNQQAASASTGSPTRCRRVLMIVAVIMAIAKPF